MVKKYEIYMCETHGKTRPCLIVSPDDMTEVLPYVIVAPITTLERRFPTRIGVCFQGQQAQIAFDLIRTIIKTDLIQKVGALPVGTHVEAQRILKEIFEA